MIFFRSDPERFLEVTRSRGRSERNRKISRELIIKER